MGRHTAFPWAHYFLARGMSQACPCTDRPARRWRAADGRPSGGHCCSCGSTAAAHPHVPRHRRAHAIASRAVWDTQMSATSRYRLRACGAQPLEQHAWAEHQARSACAQVWHACAGLGHKQQSHNSTAHPPARRGIGASSQATRPAYAGAPRGYRQLVWLRRGHCRGWHGDCDGHCYVGLHVLTGETATSAPSTRQVRCSRIGGPRSRGKLGVRPECSRHVELVLLSRVFHA